MEISLILGKNKISSIFNDTTIKYYRYSEGLDIIDDNPEGKPVGTYNLKMQDLETGKKSEVFLTRNEFVEFIRTLENVLNTGTSLDSNKGIFFKNDEQKIIATMRLINILNIADLFYGVKSEIDYKSIRYELEKNKLQDKLIEYLTEIKFPGFTLTELLRERMIQDYVKDSKTFEAIVEKVKFVNIDDENACQVETDITLDICKRRLFSKDRTWNTLFDLYREKAITREQILEILDIKYIADKYFESVNGKHKGKKVEVDIFRAIVSDDDLYKLFKTTKRSKYIKLVPIENILDRYIIDNILNDGEIEDIRQTRVDMNMINVSNATSESIIDYFYRTDNRLNRDRGISADGVIELLNEHPEVNPEQFIRTLSLYDTVKAEFLANFLLQYGNIKEEHLQQLLFQYDHIKAKHVVELLCEKNFPKRLIPDGKSLFEVHESGILVGKDMLKLADRGIIDKETLLDVYIRQEKLKEVYKSERLFCNEPHITLEEFLSVYMDKTYEENKGEDQARLDLLKLLSKNVLLPSKLIIENMDVEDISRILNDKNTLSQISEEEIDNIISKLYKLGILEVEYIALIYIENEKYAEGNLCERKLFDQYLIGNLDEELFRKSLVKPDILEEYIEGQKIGTQKLLEMFKQDIIDINMLKKISLENISEYIQIGYPEDKLEMLYRSEILTFEDLKKLNSQGVILGDWNEVREKYDKLIDVKKAMSAFIKTPVIINTAVEISDKKGNKVLQLGKNARKYRTTISSEAREDFFDSLGCIRYGYDDNGEPQYFSEEQKRSLSKEEQERLEKEKVFSREILSEGSLKGYEVIFFPELEVAIVENEKVGNASFVMNLCNALGKIRHNGKQDFKKDSTVYQVNHTKGWGSNIVTAIAEINGFNKKELLAKYSGAIEKIVQDYELNKELRDMEK